jgi:hypothetical protein
MLQPLLHQPDEIIQDRYHLAEVLGQGGIGTTYRARDVETDRWVAIKVVSLRQMKGWKTLDLLEREIKVLQALDHPAIPDYFDSFEVDRADTRVFYLPVNPWPTGLPKAGGPIKAKCRTWPNSSWTSSATCKP